MGWQGHQRQATHQRQQAAEFAVAIGANLAMDEAGSQYATGHIKASAGSKNLIFCTN